MDSNALSPKSTSQASSAGAPESSATYCYRAASVCVVFLLSPAGKPSIPLSFQRQSVYFPSCCLGTSHTKIQMDQRNDL